MTTHNACINSLLFYEARNNSKHQQPRTTPDRAELTSSRRKPSDCQGRQQSGDGCHRSWATQRSIQEKPTRASLGVYPNGESRDNLTAREKLPGDTRHPALGGDPNCSCACPSRFRGSSPACFLHHNRRTKQSLTAKFTRRLQF